MFTKAVISGIIIAISTNLYVTSENVYIGSLLFSLGLLLINEFKLELFTSRVKTLNEKSRLDFMLLILIGNIIGCYAFTLFNQQSLLLYTYPKLSKDILEILIDSVACGVLITFASTTESRIVTVLSVMAILLSKFEHSILNCCLFMSNIDTEVIKFMILNLIGNIVGAVATYRIIKIKK